jgi:hypothetical protein
MGDRLAENKRTVLAFYDLAFNQGRPAEAVEKYVGGRAVSMWASKLNWISLDTLSAHRGVTPLALATNPRREG